MRHKHCMGPNQVSPAQQVVCPTKHCVQHNFYQKEVDFIHPTHTTVYNHHMTQNKHFFPQTQSVVDTFGSEDVMMPPQGMSPQMGPRPPMGPNQVAGAQYNGNGPGPMGMGPQVAGAQYNGQPQMGPYGKGPRPGVMGYHKPCWRD
ncbi:CotD family spore coat protein [Thalassobacillus pellis]|uniref:CotD family spore coat protein n=1 Tax=Thalassobacillus pellis TaxID=748008 RepID=UPI00195FC247|nr:CotD family spore coat protein [Thalassobacillus pellis]MBM7552511.1 spore coat protein D [Thalassobacillus pellis]